MKRNFLGRIARFFIDQFEMSVLIILLILSIGIFGFLTLPKESLPEIILPTITIQAIYPGASPQEVEALLIDKIEDALTDIDDIDEVTSDSNFGVGTILVNFIEGSDIAFKKLEIDNKLSEIKLPSGVSKVESSIFKTSQIPLMNISVSGDRDIFALTAVGESLKNRIEQIPSIESVTLYGGLEKEIHVVVNHIRMLEYGVTFNDVRNALSDINVKLPLGALDLNGVHYNLKVNESLESVKMIENVLVESSSGQSIFVRDFAQVIESNEEITEFNQTFANGKLVPSIFLTVVRKANSDVIGTSKKVKSAIEKGKGVLYSDDIYINYGNDLSDSVGEDLENIQGSALSGLIVVIIILYLFIGFREALVVSITIPLSLLATIGVLNFFGMTFNAFVVLGLIVALGLLVDNSIIVMENINRLRLLKYPIVQAADEGTNQVALPILAATLTTLAAFFPLAILPGTLGDFVSTIPITIMITLVMSLFVSIVITPTVSVRLLRKWHKVKEEHFLHKLKQVATILIIGGLGYYAFTNTDDNNTISIFAGLIFASLAFLKVKSAHTFTEGSKWIRRYKIIIRKILLSRWKKVLVLMMGISILFISFGFFAMGLLKVSFFPQNEPRGLTILIDAPGGVTLEETTQITKEVESFLVEIPDVAMFNTTVGGNEIDKATINVAFKKDRILSGFELRKAIEAQMKTIPGAEIFIQTQSQGPPIGRPISIKLMGEDLEAAKNLANAYKETLQSIDGVYNVESSAKLGVPQLLIDIKERKAQTFGLTARSISDQISGQIEGVLATTINQNRDEIDVMIMKSELAIKEKREIENLYVSTPKGIMLPVSSIANIREIEGLSNIKHENDNRVIYVEADLEEGYNINDVINEFNILRKDITLADNIYVQIGGDIEGIQDSFIDLFQSMILAVFLVFIILTVQFRSVAQPFVILLTVPMAIIGVIWGLTLTQNDFGFYAFMALVALVGIAVNDAIVLIDYTNYLRKDGKSLVDSIVEAGVTRFNPVLATSMTTICGVLPLAFKDVYYAQFSFSLVFGLLITTVLTLLFIPILYFILERFKMKSHRIFRGGVRDEN